MLYKKIISNGDIFKAMHGGETIWEGVIYGMPPDLDDIKNTLYLKYGTNRIYGDKTLILQSKKYQLIPHIDDNRNFKVSLSSSNTRVVDGNGMVIEIGIATVAVTITKRVKNPHYTQNSFAKRFRIEVRGN